MPRSSRALASALLSVALAACGDAPGRAALATEAPAPARDARLAPVVAALEAGRLDEALAALGPLRAAGAAPAALAEVEARALLARGDAVGALRALEAARAASPGDARPLASEAEVYAALGRRNAAEDSLRRGLALGGARAELERARGVLGLVTPGGAAQALDALERARALDPALPFVDGPLAQAHLLAGRAALQGAPDEALAHARAGLALAPGQRELVALSSEALEGMGDFEGALRALEPLAREGRDERRALLHKKAATAALLASDRARAAEHFRRARALGLDDEGLGFGVTVLAQAAEAAVDRGYAALEEERLPEAEAAFEEALASDPTSPEARRFLGAARFRAGRYAEAAGVWQALVDDAARERLELPEPVHLDVARAWKLAGAPERARAALQAYLAGAPDGPWAADTRAMLERL